MAERPHLSPVEIDQRFQLLINSVTDYAIYMIDAAGRIATWNPGARRFKGYEAEEIIGEPYERFFTEEDRAAGVPQRALATAAAEGRFEAEGWRVRKDGTRFWAHVVLDAIKGAEGELIGFAKITRDVTDRRERDRELFASEQRFRMLVQGVRDYAIYMLDAQGNVTNWNAGAQAIKGYSESEIVGRHFSQFYIDEDRAAGEPQRALATALREGKYEREALRRRKDGSLFWAHVLIDPIYDDSGTHVGFAKITRDITERRQAEEQLEEARMALFQSQKLQAIGEMTGGIAHDFNNLMTVVRGAAELLLKAELPQERRRRYAESIIETVDRATTLTSHLLAFSRRQPLHPEVIDLAIRLDAFADVLRRTLGSLYEVEVDIGPDLCKIEADLAQLETAMLNAAINARDAMEKGGKITLSAYNAPDKDGEFVCIAITDTGPGMPREVIERAFEPFFTTKPVGKGTGLGLSQIHGFAAQTRGRAEIHSAEGRGTSIRLLLPRTHKDVGTSIAPVPADSIPEGLRVLLVEDNAQVRRFGKDLLQELGCSVASASDAEEALELLEREPFDMLFSDVVMPGMSGLALARAVRASHPEMPILLATGYSAEMTEGAGRDFPMVAKPYGASTLSGAIRPLLAAANEQARSA